MEDDSESRNHQEVVRALSARNCQWKLDKFRRLLDAPNCTAKHEKTSLLRQVGTCTWLRSTAEYRSWRSDDESFLLLHGKVGAGKTVLASVVIEELSKTKDEEEFLAYFYCDSRTGRSTSAIDVMCSILDQLVVPLCATMVEPEVLLNDLLKDSDAFYNVGGLSRFLTKVISSCPCKPLIVVDALDECSEMKTLLDGLIKHKNHARTLVTCRSLLPGAIIEMLSPYPSISMDDMANEVSADIRLYVEKVLSSHGFFQDLMEEIDVGLKEEIRSKLCAKANGMFRWVQCQIDTLTKCTSISEIRRQLENLPEGLEGTYRRIFNAIRFDNRVYRVLVWLVTALRPMQMDELLTAIMIDPNYWVLNSELSMEGADLLDVCRSFVVNHSGSELGIVTLSHMSVKDYLVAVLSRNGLPRHRIATEDMHEQLAKFCVAYIAICVHQMKKFTHTISKGSLPLRRYVLSHGFSHLSYLGPDNTGIFDDLRRLQKVISNYPQEWDQMCELAPSSHSRVPWPDSQHDFTLYILIAFGSPALFEAYLCLTPLAPREGTNPLVYAAYLGKTEHARTLVSRGVDVNGVGLIINAMADDPLDDDDMSVDESDGDDDSDIDSDISDVDDIADCKATPLMVAVDRWQAETIDLLLEKECLVPHRLLRHVLEQEPHKFPLYIIGRLLQTPAFVEWANTSWEKQRLVKALVRNVEGDSEELLIVSKRLVEVGCAKTLLLHAVGKGCIPIIEAVLLMATPSTADVTLVSHTHAILDIRASNGHTPLHYAMKISDESRCLTVVKRLVESGCDPCEPNNNPPPVYVAVMQGFISVVEYLLSKGAPLPSNILFAALQVTSLKRVKMIRLLLAAGADVHARNPDDNNLLHVAMRSFCRSLCPEIATMLVDAGCDPSARNRCGETPLSMVAKEEPDEVGNYLLLFCTSSEISSLLVPDPSSQAVALRSLIGDVGHLRFPPEQEDRLLLAIRQFLGDESKYLALTKMFMGTPDNLSTQIFYSAVEQGFRGVVEYLLSQSIPLPRQILSTALQRRVSMVPFLIRKGADLDGMEGVAARILAEAQCHDIFDLINTECPSSILVSASHFLINVAVRKGAASVLERVLSSGMTPPSGILYTALEHNINMVPLLIRTGVQLREYDGCALLRTSIRTLKEVQCLDTLKVLFSADLHFSSSSDPSCAFDHAVSRGFFSVAKYLLSNNIQLPRHILFTALKDQNLSMVDFLIREGADVHVRDDKENTLLHAALSIIGESSCQMVVETLIEAGCPTSIPNSSGEQPIHTAVSRGFTSVVEKLLSLAPNDVLPPALLFRAKSFQMVRFLVEHGANLAHEVDSEGNGLLHHMVQSLDEESSLLEAVKYLIRAGCRNFAPNVKAKSPLHLAFDKCFLSVAKYLILHDEPLPPDILSHAMKSWACDRSNYQEWKSMVSLLILKKASVEAPGANGVTPIRYSMQLGLEAKCLEAMKLLVDSGCRTSLRNDAKSKPLFRSAVVKGFVSIVEYLLSQTTRAPHDILLDVVTYRSNCTKVLRMITLFLESGADVSVRTASGDSLLHVALTQGDYYYWCIPGSWKIMEALVQAGCDPSSRDSKGRTALEIADTLNYLEVVDYLRSVTQS